jgi:hypothetical protein
MTGLAQIFSPELVWKYGASPEEARSFLSSPKSQSVQLPYEEKQGFM